MSGARRQRALDVPAKTDPALPGPPRGSVRIDVKALKRALRSAVDGEVRFDPGSLALYANDASNFRQVPVGVVVRDRTSLSSPTASRARRRSRDAGTGRRALHIAEVMSLARSGDEGESGQPPQPPAARRAARVAAAALTGLAAGGVIAAVARRSR